MKQETLYFGQVGLVHTGIQFGNVHPQDPAFHTQLQRLRDLIGRHQVLAPRLGFNTKVSAISLFNQLDHEFDGFYRTREASDGVVVSVSGATRLKVAVLIMNADCGAVEIIAPNGEMAVLHAGLDCVDPKDGSGQSIVLNALDYFAKQGVDPKDLFVRVGEAAGPCCYGLSDQRFQKENEAKAGRLRERYGERVVGVITNPPRKGGIAIDIPGIVEQQAIQGGVLPENIIVSRICTSCYGLVAKVMNDTDRFFTWFSNLREDPADVKKRGYGLRNALVVYPRN